MVSSAQEDAKKVADKHKRGKHRKKKERKKAAAAAKKASVVCAPCADDFGCESSTHLIDDLPQIVCRRGADASVRPLCQFMVRGPIPKRNANPHAHPTQNSTEDGSYSSDAHDAFGSHDASPGTTLLSLTNIHLADAPPRDQFDPEGKETERGALLFIDLIDLHDHYRSRLRVLSINCR